MAAAAATLAYGWFEAGWLRKRVLETPVVGLPNALEGLRIAHLSDFHLGRPSRGTVAVGKAVEWVRGRRPDLVVVTGDLLTHRRARARLGELLRGLDAYGVLGNHDASLVGVGATILVDDSRLLELRGVQVQLAGTAPRPGGKLPEADPAAALRILLTHYPRLHTPGYELVLAGHMHAGQITLPYPGGKIRFAHLRAPLNEGLYYREGVTLHVSPGLGTTFVPFRFLARPEATELVLRRSS